MPLAARALVFTAVALSSNASRVAPALQSAVAPACHLIESKAVMLTNASARVEVAIGFLFIVRIFTPQRNLLLMLFRRWCIDRSFCRRCPQLASFEPCYAACSRTHESHHRPISNTVSTINPPEWQLLQMRYLCSPSVKAVFAGVRHVCDQYCPKFATPVWYKLRDTLITMSDPQLAAQAAAEAKSGGGLPSKCAVM